jgi:hypothetical protein
VTHTSFARKRTVDAEIDWRPTPEKNIETMPCWGKNSPEKFLVDLRRGTHERALSPADLFVEKMPVGILLGLLKRIY